MHFTVGACYAVFQGASNIVFTNGNLDPWSGGGVLQNITGAPSLVAISIEGVRARTPPLPLAHKPLAVSCVI